jgi:hypothetical protein
MCYRSLENTLLYYHPKIQTAKNTNLYFKTPFLFKNTNYANLNVKNTTVLLLGGAITLWPLNQPKIF